MNPRLNAAETVFATFRARDASQAAADRLDVAVKTHVNRPLGDPAWAFTRKMFERAEQLSARSEREFQAHLSSCLEALARMHGIDPDVWSREELPFAILCAELGINAESSTDDLLEAQLEESLKAVGS